MRPRTASCAPAPTAASGFPPACYRSARAIAQVTRQRRPAFRAVIQRLRRARAVQGFFCWPIIHRCKTSAMGRAVLYLSRCRSLSARSLIPLLIPYSAPMLSSARADSSLFLATCRTWNLRRACARQPISVMPSPKSAL